MKSQTLIGLTAALLLSSAVARADVEISNKPTSNMSCDAGVCTATAQKAVLNVTDLAAMLASGDVAVKTGTLAKDIDVDQPLQWTSISRLTLDAQQSVIVKKQVTVAGQGALTVVTNDTGGAKAKNQSGEFIIVPERGSVQFWDLSSSLIIDGNNYTLVGDIKTLASDIAANPSGFYALAKPYDASVDGTYSASPISGIFAGTFEGLGNMVSNFKMSFRIGASSEFGFFEKVGVQGAVSDFGLVNANITGGGDPSSVGTLVAGNAGTIRSCWATGTLSIYDSSVGGLVSGNDGTISGSFADMRIIGSNTGYAGGLAAGSGGIIDRSYARGAITSRTSVRAGGGLLGLNDDGGQIGNSFSTAKIRDGRDNCCDYGGLVGVNESGTTITNAYAAGKISQSRSGESVLGGLIGDDEAAAGEITTSYWDLDKGIGDPGQGAGNKRNDQGITGLTTVQLQAGLPKGFSPKIWDQAPGKNNGLPYLRALPAK